MNKKIDKVERLRSYYEQKQRKRAEKIARINSMSRTGAKPKSTGITQSVGQVIQSSYGVGAPVQTGNNNKGGYLSKSGEAGGWKEMLKNPVYYAVGVVMIVALFIAFKK
jgi:hypothetical protein